MPPSSVLVCSAPPLSLVLSREPPSHAHNDGNLTHVTHPPAPNLKSSTIDGYFSQGFSINAVQFEGPVLVLPEMTLLWNVDDFDAITAESLVALEAIDPKTGQHDGWRWCVCMYVCGGGYRYI